MVNPNLEAGWPVILGFSYEYPNPQPPPAPVWASTSHYVVGDGYGYDWGTMYHHLNAGWGGGTMGKANSIWYNLPTYDTPRGFNLNTLYFCVYNVYPTGKGEIISGRVTGSCGTGVANVKVTATATTGAGGTFYATTNDKGIYVFPKVPSNTNFTIHVDQAGYQDQTISTGTSTDNSTTCGNRWGVNFVLNRPPVTNPQYALYSLASDTGKMSVAYAVNNLGQVVGGMKVNNSYPDYQAAAWMELQRGIFTSIKAGTLGGAGAELRGINDHGLAVGWSMKADHGRDKFACYGNLSLVNGAIQLPLQELPGGAGEAMGVNNRGEIVGGGKIFPPSALGSAVYWPSVGSDPEDLGAEFGLAPLAKRINDYGWIVGLSKNRAAQWRGGKETRTLLGPEQDSDARGLSNQSPPTIVGLLGQFDPFTYTTTTGAKAVIFNGSAVQQLDPSGKATVAHACNRNGQVVGRGFLWDPQNGLRDLNSLVNEPDWSLVDAFDINEAGEMVGWGWYKCFPLAFLLRPVNLDATFFLITATAEKGGSISPFGTLRVSPRATPTFNITVNPGYRVKDVLVDGHSVKAILSYTFPAVTSDHTIKASFEAITHTITASAGPGGSISPTGKVTVNELDRPTFTITANTGYQIADVKVDGASVGPITTNPYIYTFPPVTADRTITASFTPISGTYTITASAGPGGTIAPTGAVPVKEGDTPTFTITPNTGYRIQDVKVDGASVGAVPSYTFPAVTADHTIEASFIAVYTIVATAGPGGTISPAGTFKVDQGSSKTFVFTPNTGYRVKEVKVDGKPLDPIPPSNSYTFGNVQGNRTIDVSFEAITATYTITVTQGANGTISPSGTVTVNSGDTPTFTITANSGYKVADVKVDGVSVGAVTSYTFPPVTANHTITASFTAIVTGKTIVGMRLYGGNGGTLGTWASNGQTWGTLNEAFWVLGVSTNPGGPLLNLSDTTINLPLGNYYLYSCATDLGQNPKLEVFLSDDTKMEAIFKVAGQSGSGTGWSRADGHAALTLGWAAGTADLVGSGHSMVPDGTNDCYLQVGIDSIVGPLPPLLVFYPFEGDARDASGNGKHGAVVGATLTGGYEGQAYSFNGTNNYIMVPLDISPSPYPQLTMGAWAKAAPPSNPRRQVISQDDGGFDRSLLVGDTGWGAFCGSVGVFCGDPVVEGKWVFLAVVYDQTGGTVKLWVDDKSYTRTGVTLGAGTNLLRIGMNPSYGEHFAGTIDNVFIYNGALTDAQIASIRAGGSSAILGRSGSGKALPWVLLLLSD